MVGDQDQRAVRRNVAQAAIDDFQPQPIAFDHDIPEITPGGDLVLIAFGALDQPQPPGGVFQTADQHAPALGARRTGIADLACDVPRHVALPCLALPFPAPRRDLERFSANKKKIRRFGDDHTTL